MTQKITITPLADVTSLMVGDDADWYWEVEECYVNNAAVPFSWTDGVLNIPGYTTGVVLVRFTLYLLYDSPSGYYPSDPTDSGSDPAYWENRLRNFFAVSTSIRNFETGLTDVTGGNISIILDDDWIILNQVPVIFSNMTVRVYDNDIIRFKGISTQQTYGDYTLSLQIQKRQTILESECHWGDPAYLNRIDRTSINAYYNGTNIPEQYENYAIPMLFGPETPYEIASNSEIDLGTANPSFLIPPSTKRGQRIADLSDAKICRIIPTSATTGIIGRMPSYQSLVTLGFEINEALIGGGHFFSASVEATNPVIVNAMIKGEVCTLERTAGGSPIVNSGRYYNRSGSTSYFILGADDPVFAGGTYDLIKDCNQKVHFFPSAVPNTNWTGATVLSGTFTPVAGHRWLTVSVTGIDLFTNDCFIVLTGISGARSSAEVMQFALESHGYTVDSASFAAMASEFPQTTIQQAGSSTDVPTLGEFVAELNEALLTVLVFPASNDEPFLVKIDPTEAATITLTDRQIAGLRSTEDYKGIAYNTIFRPKYARSDAFKNTLTSDLTSDMGTLFNAEKTLEIDHVLSSFSARFYEVTNFNGSPNRLITFDLLDDEVEIELADIVQIDHPEFSQKICIVSKASKPIGRTIQGRYLYVNNS